MGHEVSEREDPTPVPDLAKGKVSSSKKGAKKANKSAKADTVKTAAKSAKVTHAADKKVAEKVTKDKSTKEKTVIKAQSGTKGGYYHGD